MGFTSKEEKWKAKRKRIENNMLVENKENLEKLKTEIISKGN